MNTGGDDNARKLGKSGLDEDIEIINGWMNYTNQGKILTQCANVVVGDMILEFFEENISILAK